MTYCLKQIPLIICCLLALTLVSAPVFSVVVPNQPPFPPLHFYEASIHAQHWLETVQPKLAQAEAEARAQNLSAEALAASLLKTQCELENDALASHLMHLHRQVFMQISEAIGHQQIFAPATRDFLVLQQLLMHLATLIRTLEPEAGLALAHSLQQFLTQHDPLQLEAQTLQKWLHDQHKEHAAKLNDAVRQGLRLYDQYHSDQQQAHLERGQEATAFVLHDIPRLQRDLIAMLTWVEENYLWLQTHWGEEAARAGHSKLQQAYRAMSLKPN